MKGHETGKGAMSNRVLRGGSWNNNANNARSANRNNNTPSNRNNNNGFRLASTRAPESGRVRLPGESDPVQPSSDPGVIRVKNRAAGCHEAFPDGGLEVAGGSTLRIPRQVSAANPAVQRVKPLRVRGRWAVGPLAALLLLLLHMPLSAQEGAPIRVGDLIGLLVEGVPANRILSITLQASCVEGGAEQVGLESLRAAGASPELLRAVERFACEARSPAEGPAPAGEALGVGFGDDQFALIPAGSFQMGSTNGGSDERPVHTVNITRAFRMQRTEVTQGQWREIMGSNPSSFSSCGDTCPVERVSWNDIQQFLTALNQRFPGRNYRLPTEAEWEYAARAGTTGDYGGTGVLDEMGWYRDNSGSRTHPVAGKQPNAWGLYDMHGNVFEWVQDWYSSSYYSVSPANDPPGPSSGSGRVLRGGSWFISAVGARSAYRFGTPSVRYSVFGFRLARTP